MLRLVKSGQIFKALGWGTAACFTLVLLSMSVAVAQSNGYANVSVYTGMFGAATLVFLVFDALACSLWLLLWFVRKYA